MNKPTQFAIQPKCVGYDRPSPFTIPDSLYAFAEGEPSETPQARHMTVGNLIANLTTFAEFYEEASDNIQNADSYEKRYLQGMRDVNAASMKRQFLATVAIERVRSFILSTFGEELTIKTATHFLGCIINTCSLTSTKAEQLQLQDAMNRLEKQHGKSSDRRNLTSEPTTNDERILSKSLLVAWRQFESALRANLDGSSEEPTLKSLYAWCKSVAEDVAEDGEEDELPKFETWCKYVRSAREKLGRPRLNARPYGSPRSAVPVHELQ